MLKRARIDWRLAALAAAFVLQIVFFAPLRVFLRNPTDFALGPLHALAGTATMAAVLVVLCYLPARRWPRLAVPLLALLAIVAWMESTIFLGLAGHRPFDGQPIDWSHWRVLSMVELAAAAIVGLAVVLWRRRTELWHGIAVAILLFHSLGLAYAAYEGRRGLYRHVTTAIGAYYEGFYRLSTRRNILHLVVDTTQGAMVHDIVQSDPGRYARVLDGFTMFPQAMGRYRSTYPSVPYYMTGHGVEPERDIMTTQPFTADDVRNTLAEHSMLKALAGAGFDRYGYHVSALYCADAWTACTAGMIFDGRSLQADSPGAILLHLVDIALFQTTPLVLRERVYNDGGWLLKGAQGGGRTYSAILDLFLERMTTDSPADAYRYFHLAGGHGPVQFDETCTYIGVQQSTYANQRRQVICSLAQIERLIEALKQRGVYDQTMIVVHGDHGTPGLPASLSAETGEKLPSFLIGPASVLLLVKPMHARGPMRVSEAQATIGDLPATIASALSIDADFPGTPLFALDGADRERQYMLYDTADYVTVLQALPNLRRYRVRGNLFDEDSWTRPRTGDGGGTPTALWMDDERFERYATGFGKLEVQDKAARWALGRRVEMKLAFPGPGPAQLAFETYVPPGAIPGQSMTASINGTTIGRLDAEALSRSRRHEMPIPDGVRRDAANTVVFEMSTAVHVTAGGDDRWLSAVFAYVGIEPER